ncbi:monovalent cation/H+ antiporter complex subunit F [Oceanotoga sp. DSM 15011]|uniref:Multisubunit sodium/proton antiporter MrpF subunit n=1 Tax=Oceanotoga teriensis TaxID=515440 RepID=A0AA45C4R9_9BACT|nr:MULTISPECIES: monovalent cation/H+ antiporter complex subunit F [Oceanotoga]MDO7977739.1 monovalent cation/H+ antiporter complex subunit F [Oceanotoga teriensis]PWJ87146.1 multisubunit sodium/proton antiporter MrpF subunit [Oceanotoga teriensis]UYP00738.1 monovalent cation/H+ antiporter complex subunit F [Oceanotoga sp. DSM 15011]
MNNIIQIFLMLSLIITVYKLINGPTQWDRLLAYSSFSSKVILIMLIYIFESKQFFLLDMIIVFLLLNIFGILITTRFLQKGGKKK